MQCAEFYLRLQQRLDARQSPAADEQLRAHAADCDDCREVLQTQRTLLRAIEVRRVRLPERFSTADLVHRVARQSCSDRRSWNAIFAVGLSVAATLMLIALPIMRMANRTKSPTAVRGAGGVAATVGTSRGTKVRPGTIGAVQATDRRSRASIHAPPIATALPGDTEVFRALMQGLVARISEIPEDQREQIENLAGGFRPLASTFSGAYGALRRTIPVGRSRDSSEPQAGASLFDNEPARMNV